LVVLPRPQVRQASVIIWMIIVEDITICSFVVVFFGMRSDRRAHFLDHELPLPFFDSGDAGIVVVVPRRERGRRNRQQRNRENSVSLHCFVTSFSSSSRFTPPRSTAFGTFWPASIWTSNVV